MGAGAVVYVFSTTDKASFDELPEWEAKVTAEAPGIAAVVVQNKVDLLEQAVVTPEEAEELASRLRLKFYRTSVKDDVNVRPMFEYLAESALAPARQTWTFSLQPKSRPNNSPSPYIPHAERVVQ